VACHDPLCTNGVASLIAFCDGAGNCPPADQQACPTGSTCAGDLCVGGQNSCATDGDCNSNQYCAGGVCVGKKTAGVGCNTGGECQSSVCVDGVCCTRACTGQCEACNVEGSKGTCVAVSGEPRGSRQPCTSDKSDCGGSCDGVTADRCDYPGAETPCRVGKCAGSLADLAANCQGNGSCAPLQQQSCDPVGCDSNAVACAGPCKVDGDCATGQYCSAAMCVPKLADGAPCATKSQCTNANCVDGVCCNSACGGQCQSCDQAGSLGTCVAVPGAPRNGRPACAGSGTCGGFCDGTNGAECALPGLNTTCGVEFCFGSSSTPAPKCGGNATCIIPAARSCDPYRCDDQRSTCLTTCELDTDCAPGLVCITGGCSQPLPDAGTPPVDAGAGAGGSGNESGGRTSTDAGSGTPGSGGTPAGGTAGASGAGGRGGVGGTPNTGGGLTTSPDAGLGGSPAADGGPSGKDAGTASSQDSGSCGCRVPGSNRRSSEGVFLLVGLVLLAATRRRKHEQAYRARG
jgi:MYXO-CTERM domain-containing protein